MAQQTVATDLPKGIVKEAKIVQRHINNAKDTTDRFCLINCFVERYIEAAATKETGQVV